MTLRNDGHFASTTIVLNSRIWPMDKLQQIGHLVITALVKARELNELDLGAEAKQKIKELLKIAKDNLQKIEFLTKVTADNGKLDKATVDSALDRILTAMKGVNEELDTLLAKARK